MRKLSIKRKTAFAIMMLICSMVIFPAAAEIGGAEHFRDVPQTHPYFNAVTFMSENHITNGIGNDLYGVNNNITMKQAMIFLYKAFAPEEVKTAIDSAKNKDLEMVSQFKKQGWIDFCGDPAEVNLNMSVSRRSFFEDALEMKGFVLYSDASYGNVLTDKQGNQYSGAMRLAYQLGLTDNPAPLDMMTRGEAAQMIYLLSQPGLPAQEMPEVVSKIERLKSEFGSVPDDFAIVMTKVPDKVYKLFNENGWTMVYGTEYMNQYNVAHGTSGIGLCEPSSKTCYVAGRESIIHEMGHALKQPLLKMTGYSDSKVRNIWMQEGAAAATFLRPYANTNDEEFFAELFCHYIENHGNEKWMSQFEKEMPESKKLMDAMNLFEPVELNLLWKATNKA